MQILTDKTRPKTIIFLIVLFSFGMVMSLLAVFTLLFPQSRIQGVWSINPEGHQAFLKMGAWSFLVLCPVTILCFIAASGLALHRKWGYYAANVLLGLNLLGDIGNIILRDEYRSLIGIPIATVLLILLNRSNLRRYFGFF